MMKKQTTQKKQELIYGVHPILELLKAKKRKIFTIYTTKPFIKAWHSIQNLLGKETQVQYVDKDVLNKLAGTTDHQGVVAWAAPIVIRSKFFDKERSKFLILLDGIQDPRNLGAILRSSYCTGVDGVILCGKNSSPLNAVAYKSSAGLSEHLEIYIAPTAANAVHELKNAGYDIYLAALDGEDATKIEYKKPLCLVIGNEGTGISKNIITSGKVVTLPQKTADISYNASVAAGILLFIISCYNK